MSSSDGTLRELRPEEPEIGVRYPIYGASDAKDALEVLRRGFAVRLYHEGKDGEYHTDHAQTETDGIAMYNSVWKDGAAHYPPNPLESTEAELGFGVAKATEIEILQPENSILKLEVA